MTDTGQRVFRWGILGTGPVARKFALDLKAMGDRVSLEAVASRAQSNARRFAADLGVAHALPDYEAVAASDVDALYIATPAALHEAHALLGIAAGKAVLVEKPMATQAAAARRIAQAAQDAGVFCMEAMWTRLQPLPDLVRTRIAEGAIGTPLGLDGRFMAANLPDAQVSLFDPERGGGGLLHRGIYPLSMAQFLLGPVVETRALGRIGQTGVDEDSVVLLRHENGALSTVRASLRAAGPEGTTIYGTEGTITLQGPVWRPTGAVLRPTRATSAAASGPRRFERLRESGAGLRLSGMLGRARSLTGRNTVQIRAPFAGNGYRHEAEAVMQAVAAGHLTDPRMPPRDSIAVLETIEAVQAAWTKGQQA